MVGCGWAVSGRKKSLRGSVGWGSVCGVELSEWDDGHSAPLKLPFYTPLSGRALHATAGMTDVYYP